VSAKKPDKDYIPNVFIYQIPDEEEVSEIGDNSLNTKTDVKTPVLKSEIQYFDHIDTVTMDKTVNAKNINLSKPQKITAKSLSDYGKKKEAKKAELLSVTSSGQLYNGDINIWNANYDNKQEYKRGGFSLGTSQSAEVANDTNFSYTSGLFAKYQIKNFSLNTKFQRTSTMAQQLTFGNSISITPEYRLNKAIAVKNEFKADLTKNRKSSELILMLTPFAYKGNDRFNLEAGVGQTYDGNNALMKTKFEFNTKFQL